MFLFGTKKKQQEKPIQESTHKRGEEKKIPLEMEVENESRNRSLTVGDEPTNVGLSTPDKLDWKTLQNYGAFAGTVTASVKLANSNREELKRLENSFILSEEQRILLNSLRITQRKADIVRLMEQLVSRFITPAYVKYVRKIPYLRDTKTEESIEAAKILAKTFVSLLSKNQDADAIDLSCANLPEIIRDNIEEKEQYEEIRSELVSQAETLRKEMMASSKEELKKEDNPKIEETSLNFISDYQEYDLLVEFSKFLVGYVPFPITEIDKKTANDAMLDFHNKNNLFNRIDPNKIRGKKIYFKQEKMQEFFLYLAMELGIKNNKDNNVEKKNKALEKFLIPKNIKKKMEAALTTWTKKRLSKDKIGLNNEDESPMLRRVSSVPLKKTGTPIIFRENSEKVGKTRSVSDVGTDTSASPTEATMINQIENKNQLKVQ